MGFRCRLVGVAAIIQHEVLYEKIIQYIVFNGVRGYIMD